MRHIFPNHAISGVRACAAGLILGVIWLQPAAAFTYPTDPGTFSTPTWSETILGGGDVVDTRETSGGNLGAYLRLQTIPDGTGAAPIVAGFYANSAATWNPSTQGAIASVDLGIDVILFKGVSGYTDGQAYGIGLEQGGKVYFGGFPITGLQSTWDSRTITGKTQTNFSLFNTDGTIDNTAKPNFSPTGGQITFGLIVGNSGSASGSGTIAGYDNWSLTVNPATTQVPEPGTLAIFGLGLAGLGFARRRKAA